MPKYNKQIIASYFVYIDKLIYKGYEEIKRPRIINTVVKEENKVRGLMLLLLLLLLSHFSRV